jgi:hypothetical protein
MSKKKPRVRSAVRPTPRRGVKPRPTRRRGVKPRPARRRGVKPRPAAPVHLDGPAGMDIHELDSLRAEIDRLAAASSPRWNANPDDVRRSVGKLVLTLVEFIRQLLERQAIRRMDAGTLTAEEIEAVGLALMRLEETVRDLAQRFGLDPDDLNLDLGPVGRLV